jgi:general secretion pathway protein A
MYKSFFGLQEEPFNLTSDPRHMYLSQSHGKALEQLTRGIQEKKGLIVLTGQVGAGKTMLARTLLEQIGTGVKTAFVLYPRLDVPDFLQYVVNEFGLQPNVTTPTQNLVLLEQFLIDQRAKGNPAVLIVDEAQHLSPEHVRLLSDLEVGGEKLLQIVLVGQDELQRKLQLPSWCQLHQRIGTFCEILPLSLAETQTYIEHHFTIAGGDARAVFHPQVFQIIHRYSIGIPRLIQNLCNDVLIAAYADGKQRVTPGMVRQIVRDRKITEGVPHPLSLAKKDSDRSDRQAHIGDETIREAAAHRPPSVLRKGLTILVSLVVLGTTFYTLEGADTFSLWVSHVQTSSQRVYQVIKARTQHLMAGLSEPHDNPSGRPVQPKPVVEQQDTFQTPARHEPAGLEASTATAEDEKRLFPVKITVTGRDSVARHARDIYGFVSPQLLQLIMAYNTHIEDINNLQTGDGLIFPAPDDLLE